MYLCTELLGEFSSSTGKSWPVYKTQFSRIYSQKSERNFIVSIYDLFNHIENAKSSDTIKVNSVQTWIIFYKVFEVLLNWKQGFVTSKGQFSVLFLYVSFYAEFCS